MCNNGENSFGFVFDKIPIDSNETAETTAALGLFAFMIGCCIEGENSIEALRARIETVHRKVTSMIDVIEKRAKEMEDGANDSL